MDGGDQVSEDSGYGDQSSVDFSQLDINSAPDPLRQLLTALCRTAMAQDPDDRLYLAFAKIMAKVRL